MFEEQLLSSQVTISEVSFFLSPQTNVKIKIFANYIVTLSVMFSNEKHEYSILYRD